MTCRQVLRYGWWTLLCMFYALPDVVDSRCWALLMKLEAEGLDLFSTAIAEQMKRLNRAVNWRLEIDKFIDYADANEARFATTALDAACPCGSGKTYGECHRIYDAACAHWAGVPKFGDEMLLRP